MQVQSAKKYILIQSREDVSKLTEPKNVKMYKNNFKPKFFAKWKGGGRYVTNNFLEH